MIHEPYRTVLFLVALAVVARACWRFLIDAQEGKGL